MEVLQHPDRRDAVIEALAWFMATVHSSEVASTERTASARTLAVLLKRASRCRSGAAGAAERGRSVVAFAAVWASVVERVDYATMIPASIARARRVSGE